MKHSTTFAAIAALALGGCNGAYWGNLIVLGVSLGVFYGTLTLQRGTATRSQTDGLRTASSQMSAKPSGGAQTNESA